MVLDQALLSVRYNERHIQYPNDCYKVICTGGIQVVVSWSTLNSKLIQFHWVQTTYSRTAHRQYTSL